MVSQPPIAKPTTTECVRPRSQLVGSVARLARSVTRQVIAAVVVGALLLEPPIRAYAEPAGRFITIGSSNSSMVFGSRYKEDHPVPVAPAPQVVGAVPVPILVSAQVTQSSFRTAQEAQRQIDASQLTVTAGHVTGITVRFFVPGNPRAIYDVVLPSQAVTAFDAAVQALPSQERFDYFVRFRSQVIDGVLLAAAQQLTPPAPGSQFTAQVSIVPGPGAPVAAAPSGLPYDVVPVPVPAEDVALTQARLQAQQVVGQLNSLLVTLGEIEVTSGTDRGSRRLAATSALQRALGGFTGRDSAGQEVDFDSLTVTELNDRRTRAEQAIASARAYIAQCDGELTTLRHDAGELADQLDHYISNGQLAEQHDDLVGVQARLRQGSQRSGREGESALYTLVAETRATIRDLDTQLRAPQPAPVAAEPWVIPAAQLDPIVARVRRFTPSFPNPQFVLHLAPADRLVTGTPPSFQGTYEMRHYDVRPHPGEAEIPLDGVMVVTYADLELAARAALGNRRITITDEASAAHALGGPADPRRQQVITHLTQRYQAMLGAFLAPYGFSGSQVPSIAEFVPRLVTSLIGTEVDFSEGTPGGPGGADAVAASTLRLLHVHDGDLQLTHTFPSGQWWRTGSTDSTLLDLTNATLEQDHRLDRLDAVLRLQPNAPVYSGSGTSRAIRDGVTYDTMRLTGPSSSMQVLILITSADLWAAYRSLPAQVRSAYPPIRQTDSAAIMLADPGLQRELIAAITVLYWQGLVTAAATAHPELDISSSYAVLQRIIQTRITNTLAVHVDETFGSGGAPRPEGGRPAPRPTLDRSLPEGVIAYEGGDQGYSYCVSGGDTPSSAACGDGTPVTVQLTTDRTLTLRAIVPDNFTSDLVAQGMLRGVVADLISAIAQRDGLSITSGQATSFARQVIRQLGGM